MNTNSVTKLPKGISLRLYRYLQADELLFKVALFDKRTRKRIEENADMGFLSKHRPKRFLVVRSMLYKGCRRTHRPGLYLKLASYFEWRGDLTYPELRKKFETALAFSTTHNKPLVIASLSLGIGFFEGALEPCRLTTHGMGITGVTRLLARSFVSRMISATMEGRLCYRVAYVEQSEIKKAVRRNERADPAPFKYCTEVHYDCGTDYFFPSFDRCIDRFARLGDLPHLEDLIFMSLIDSPFVTSNFVFKWQQFSQEQ